MPTAPLNRERNSVVGFASPAKPKTKKFWVLRTYESDKDQIDLDEVEINIPINLPKKECRKIYKEYLGALEKDGGDRARAIALGIPPASVCLAAAFCRAHLKELQALEQGSTVPNQLFLETAVDSTGIRQVVGRFSSFDWEDNYFGGKSLRAN